MSQATLSQMQVKLDASGNPIFTLANTMAAIALPADALGLLKDDGSGNLSWASLNPLVATSITVSGAAEVGSLAIDTITACSTGTATLTFKTSNSSVASLTQTNWIPVTSSGVTYWLPAFSATHA